MNASRAQAARRHRGAVKAGGSVLMPGLLLMLGTIPAKSAVIDSISVSVFPGSSTGTTGPVGATPAPNNDNSVAASPNVVPCSIFYDALGTVPDHLSAFNPAGLNSFALRQSPIIGGDTSRQRRSRRT